MFLYQETYYVRPGLQDVIDQRVRSLHVNHATNAAAAAMDWSKYLGDGTTFLAFRLWHERNVTYDEKQLAWMREYNRTRPADAFVAPPDIELFDQVDQAETALPGGTFLIRTEIQAGGASAWGALEAELKQRLLGNTLFAEYRLYRFLGAETRYFRTEFWHTREAANEFWRHEDMRDFTTRLIATLRRPPEAAHYEILHQLGSAKPLPTLIKPAS